MHDSQVLVNAHFQSTAPDWRTIYSSQDVHSRLYQHRRAEVLSLASGLDLAPGSRVLDVGCGPGLIAVELARQGHLVEAVDSVPEMLGMTRELAIASNVSDRVVCHVADVMQLPVEAGRYDLVVAVGVTEWLSSLTAAMQELSRVLKPGGFLIVTSTNPWSLQYLPDPVKNPVLLPLKETARRLLMALGRRKPKAVCHTRSARALRSATREAGLEPVGYRRFGFGPFTLFSKRLFSNSMGWRIHLKLQELADKNWPILRSTGHVYIEVARKHGIEKSSSRLQKAS